MKIAPAADCGFTVSWTTVRREGGDAKTSSAGKRETSMTFAPGRGPACSLRSTTATRWPAA